jgi:NAD(P)-dependent dehydrogenase (short-subunit alcohol dehydrogenase family)
MELHLKGKVALVTGASKGIGLASARMLAEEGCDVILLARDKAALDTATADIHRSFGVQATAIAADLSHSDEIDRVASQVDGIDILVNNAGSIPPGDLAAVSREVWRKAWDLKVFGFIDLSRALYANLKGRGGVIVNVIGSAGEAFPPGYIAGASGNAALMAFTKALGKQAPADGMRVVAINPGPVLTDRLVMSLRNAAAKSLGDAEQWQDMTRHFPFGRAATPDEIASAVCFLASIRSGYTSGTVLTINAGG